MSNPLQGVVTHAQLAETSNDIISAKRLLIPASAMSVGTGSPSLALYTTSIARIPYWSMSGITAGQGVTSFIRDFEGYGDGVEISAIIMTPAGTPSDTSSEVLQIMVSQLEPGQLIDKNNIRSGAVIHKTLPVNTSGKVILESFVPINPSLPISVLLSRLVADTADTWETSIGIAGLELKPVKLPEPKEIQPADKYNAWPFISSVGEKLVCVYGKGLTHEDTDSADIYIKTSIDGGNSWSDERLIINTVGVRDTVTGKGKDPNGNILLWVRKGYPGPTSTHHIYRSNDGEAFELISSPTFDVAPTHISDIFSVPSVGLMAFYNDVSFKSWGVVVSADNGITWNQTEIGTALSDAEYPTEISGTYINDGKIIALGRKEYGTTADPTYAMFQIQSNDYGVTWTKTRTNITDISLSTPSLVYDSVKGILSLYYFHRGFGVLRLRKSSINDVWDNPLNWETSQPITFGTRNSQDTGNVNAIALGDKHIAVFYSGDATNTGIYATFAEQ